MTRRRGTYFAFQGLLTAVLLLLFTLYARDAAGWVLRFAFLVAVFGASLILIQLAPARRLDDWPLQTGLFIGDALAAFLVLRWTEGNPLFYLLFLVVLFGSALTRRTSTTIFVAAASSLLYFAAEWQMEGGFPDTTAFWLRLHFLWIITILLALLARDSRQAQEEAEERYRVQLAHLESLATLGQIAGEVAHRIKGPLTTIRVNSEILADKEGDKARKQDLIQVLEAVDHIKAVLKDLLDLGRLEEVDYEKIDLRKPLERALDGVRPQADAKKVVLKSVIASGKMPVRADESLLLEAFSALLQNAVEAVAEGGRVDVTLRPAQAPSWFARADELMHSVRIVDNGEGFAKTRLPKLFKPFYTTKGADGTGLGLASALRIVQLHKGAIDVHSDGEGLGAEFTVRLPSL